MLRIKANAIGNANVNGNAPQDQGAAGQDDEVRQAARAQPRPAVGDPGDEQVQLGGPVGGTNINAPAHPMFIPPHLGGPGGNENFYASLSPAFLSDLGDRGGNVNFNAAVNPALQHRHFGAPPGALYGAAPGMMVPGLGGTGLSADLSPAQIEVNQLLSNPQSPQFFKFYVEPSQRFLNDAATGSTALMLAAEAGDFVAVGALMSRTILLRRASDGYVVDYHHHICDDERERRGVMSEFSFRHRTILLDGGFVNIPAHAGLPPSSRMIGHLLHETVNARAFDGRSPLIFAAGGGNVAVAETLVGKGADIHARAHDGRTALAIAVDNGHAGMAEFLISVGGLVSPFAPIEDEIERIGFSLAARKGHVEVVRTLLNEIPVITACRNSQLAGQLTEEIYPETAINEMLRESRQDAEKLIAAANDKNPKTLETLVKDKSTSWLNAALRIACGHGLANAVKPLLRGGADVNAKTKAGQTALLVAVEYGHAEVVKELAENGAAVNQFAIGGSGALSRAAQGGDPKIMRYLLSHLTIERPFLGSNHAALSQHDDAEYALNIVAERGDIKIVRMLLDETPARTYSPPQLVKAREIAQAAGQADVVRLLNCLEPVSRLLHSAHGFDPDSLIQLEELFKSSFDVNLTLGKERQNSFLAMLNGSIEISRKGHAIPAGLISHYRDVGKILLRAGVDATVRNDVGESVLKLAAMARALDLANLIVLSGQCEEFAGNDVRNALLNNEPRHRHGILPSVEFTLNNSLLDWLVFSEPVLEQAKHYPKLQYHGLWPQDPNNVEQRRAAMRLAAQNGCAGVVLTLGGEAEKEVIRELLLLAAESGSWNVVKAMYNAGWEDIFDKDIMRAALESAVKHKQHAAVDGIFRLNELLRKKPSLPGGRTLVREDMAAAIRLVASDSVEWGVHLTDFKMLERLIRSTPRALLPEGGWPNGPSQPLGKDSLRDHQAWATFDHIWCAQGVSDAEKGFLQPHARWPLDEQDGAQISFAMEAAARSGCPNLFSQLQQLPALEQWRRSQENAAAFDAMMQRAVLAAAEGGNHNMFALM